MDRKPQPPWYRLHFVTWLAILMVGGGLGWGSFENVRKQFPYQRSLHLGWPLVAGVVIDKSNRKTQPAGTVRGYRWRKFGSIFDVTVAVLILGSMGFAVERRFRAEMSWQIRVTTLLSATAVVAAALCCAQDGRTIFFRLAKWVGEPSPLFVDISFRSWAVKLPILFGLACTIYAMGRMNIWLIGMVLRWVTRSRWSAMYERTQPFDVCSPSHRSRRQETCTGVSGDGLAHLVSLAGLKHLALGGPNMTARGWSHVGGLKNIESLTLTGRHIGDAVTVHLRQMNDLSTLIFKDTRITDASLANLAALGRLTALHLQGSSVSDAGLVELAKLEKLQILNLTSTRVTEAGAAKLKDLLPNCQILGSSGLEVQR